MYLFTCICIYLFIYFYLWIYLFIYFIFMYWSMGLQLHTYVCNYMRIGIQICIPLQYLFSIATFRLAGIVPQSVAPDSTWSTWVVQYGVTLGYPQTLSNCHVIGKYRTEMINHELFHGFPRGFQPVSGSFTSKQSKAPLRKYALEQAGGMFLEHHPMTHNCLASGYNRYGITQLSTW